MSATKVLSVKEIKEGLKPFQNHARVWSKEELWLYDAVRSLLYRIENIEKEINGETKQL